MLPHFLNFRRTKKLKKEPESIAVDEKILSLIETSPSISVYEIESELRLDYLKYIKKGIARLMMEGRILMSDGEIYTFKNGNKTVITKYSTPEWLYGADIVATCNPAESYKVMYSHIRPLLQDTPEVRIKKLLGYIRKHI